MLFFTNIDYSRFDTLVPNILPIKRLHYKENLSDKIVDSRKKVHGIL